MRFSASPSICTGLPTRSSHEAGRDGVGDEHEDAPPDGDREAEEFGRDEGGEGGAEGVEEDAEGDVDGADQPLSGSGAPGEADQLLPFVHDVHRIPYLRDVLNCYCLDGAPEGSFGGFGSSSVHFGFAIT